MRVPLSIVLVVASVAQAQIVPETTVSDIQDEPEELSAERATSTVTRKDLERRLPRSAPDALRYEPGVFVQQSAHGQGSAYLRGLTGQQTLLLFDGIRMNNSTYRQGPNQYFFTLDARTIRSIEVQRGGASTRWGSDALGGAIDAHPIEPLIAKEGFALEPRVSGRMATADHDLGGRFQVEASGTTHNVGIGFVGGIGARKAGLINGPPVLNPNTTTAAGELPWIPRYKEYRPTLPFDQQPALRTQLGTGFEELTGDARLVLQLPGDQQLTFAGSVYREYNAPRTDACPPPTAPFDQCLTYEQQFRHLGYVAWSSHLGLLASDVRLTLSWQEQHEQRRLDLTAANLVGRGFDDVETWGLTARAQTAQFQPASGLSFRVEYGADTYVDWLRSRAEHTYTDTLDTVVESRGQYLDGSTYVYGGLSTDLIAELGSRVTVRGGARVSWTLAHASEDPQSGTQGVDRAWFPVVGHTGVEWKVIHQLRLFANYDASFRAPNLDDLTSRQQTGPGFQFENAALEPERAHTFELGGRLRSQRVVADLWLFETLLDNAIIRVSKSTAQCPLNTPACQGSWSRFQLENSPSSSELRGAEAALKVFFPGRVSLRASASGVWSEGPKVGEVSSGVTGVVLGSRVPLSRTPPVNGTVELGWTHASGFAAGAALQWAAEQKRLALADYSDGRIPRYGTPGFAVVSLRASWRLGTKVLISAVLENLFDSPYRFHGSSVNGAGRGVMIYVEAGRLFEL